ncbi:hypothetical protein [Silvimonas sp.]|uniref:hypothetical protein n=1 Tax=Silvimonas sp. TaxID=2650811 RepID=UPI0028487E91|nr:hypothetical protein [Silvimonas sp.]MDR3429583.1 hypothetical protein [Silvimonas sp.]
MAEGHFDAPVFIKELYETTVNITDTPFFYNDGGQPVYLNALPAGVTPLEPATTNPAVAIGNEYIVAEVMAIKPTPPYGVETQLGFIAKEVVYEPMWATRDIAAAFGITLVEPGQGVPLSSPVHTLSQVEYEYGVFAGHWSPYQNTGNNLLTVVCTDLEHHDFPHVFASTDPEFPLVISVARYWPKLSKICVADLWVRRGCALYIPPKPAHNNPECIDLHNNRNSARACWGDIKHGSVVTKTLLQTENGFFYWYWNAAPTVHTNLAAVR